MEKPAVDEFPVVGEPLALDLINTRVRTAEGETDLLATPAALRAWLAIQAERLPQPDARSMRSARTSRRRSGTPNRPSTHPRERCER
jgi:hypothetical protein